jgi:hypothetical protein
MLYFSITAPRKMQWIFVPPRSGKSGMEFTPPHYGEPGTELV